AQVGTIRADARLHGNLLSTLGGLACLNEFGFGSLPFGDIPDCGRNQRPTPSLDGAQADFDRKFAAIAALREKLQPYSHGPRVGGCEIPVSMTHVMRPEALRQPLFDRLPNYFLMR